MRSQTCSTLWIRTVRIDVNRMFVFFERDFEDLADEAAINMYCEWLEICIDVSVRTCYRAACLARVLACSWRRMYRTLLLIDRVWSQRLIMRIEWFM